MSRIQKGDLVAVLTGKDKGKQGRIIKVLPKKNKILVEGIALVVRHIKPKKKGNGGIRKEESFIDVSNVIPVCVSCKKPCRINIKFVEEGKKARMCNRCKKNF